MKSSIQFERVVVISDLHLGDSKENNLDEFGSDDEFEKLLLEIIPSQVGWPATLVINGDFIDFPQVLPELSLHTLGPRFGVAEVQSFEKINRVFDAHRRVFDSLRKYLEAGGQVILLPGNHDIDFHWPSVLAALRTKIGGWAEPHLRFIANGFVAEKGIYIEHGNQYAFDNRFEYWGNPVISSPDGPRLERPWGTFFMDTIYNDIEMAFPALYKTNPDAESLALKSAHRYLRKSINAIYPHYHAMMIYMRSLLSQPWITAKLARRLIVFFLQHGKRFTVGRMLGAESRLERAVDDLPALIDFWLPEWSPSERQTLATAVSGELSPDNVHRDGRPTGSSRNLLGNSDNVGMRRRTMELIAQGETTVVIFGHTHISQDGNQSPILGKMKPYRVFNTGSWIPCLSVDNPFDAGPLDELRRLPLRSKLKYLVVRLAEIPTAELLAVLD